VVKSKEYLRLGDLTVMKGYRTPTWFLTKERVEESQAMKSSTRVLIFISVAICLAFLSSCQYKPPEQEPEPEWHISPTIHIENEEIELGESADVWLEVSNLGHSAGSYTLTVTVDGSVVKEEVAYVPSMASNRVYFSLDLELGIHIIDINGLNTTITVIDPRAAPTFDESWETVRKNEVLSEAIKNASWYLDGLDETERVLLSLFLVWYLELIFILGYRNS